MPATLDPEDSPQSRVEAEVLEILERTDRPPSNVIKFRAKVRTTTPRLRDRIGSTDALQDPLVLLGTSLALALFAYFTEDASTLAARVFGILGLIAFVAAYVIGLRRPRSGPGAKTWRGRDVNLPPPTRWR